MFTSRRFLVGAANALSTATSQRIFLLFVRTAKRLFSSPAFHHGIGLASGVLVVTCGYYMLGYSTTVQNDVANLNSLSVKYSVYRPNDLLHLVGVASAKAIDRTPGVVMVYDMDKVCMTPGGAEWPRGTFEVGRVLHGNSRAFLEPVSGSSMGSYDYEQACELFKTLSSTNSKLTQKKGIFGFTNNSFARRELARKGLHPTFVGLLDRSGKSDLQ